MKKYQVYQTEGRNAFMSWGSVENFNFQEWNKVYEGELLPEEDVTEELEDIYYICNLRHPEGYKGRSLSTSDIVMLEGQYFFCDSFGWENITKMIQQ